MILLFIPCRTFNESDNEISFSFSDFIHFSKSCKKKYTFLPMCNRYICFYEMMIELAFNVTAVIYAISDLNVIL